MVSTLFLLYNCHFGNIGCDIDIYETDSPISNIAINQIACGFMLCTLHLSKQCFIYYVKKVRTCRGLIINLINLFKSDSNE